jgi:hypothetical protein
MEGAWQGRAHLLWSFCLRRGTLKLSAHLSLEGGTLERRVQDQGQGKGKARFKGTSKGKSQRQRQGKGQGTS